MTFKEFYSNVVKVDEKKKVSKTIGFETVLYKSYSQSNRVNLVPLSHHLSRPFIHQLQKKKEPHR